MINYLKKSVSFKIDFEVLFVAIHFLGYELNNVLILISKDAINNIAFRFESCF